MTTNVFAAVLAAGCVAIAAFYATADAMSFLGPAISRTMTKNLTLGNNTLGWAAGRRKI